VGKDEAGYLLGAPARLPEVVEDDPLRGGDAAIDEGDLLAVDEVGVDEPRDGGSGRVYYLEGDLQGVDRGWDRHGLHDLIELSIKWFGAYIRFDRRTAMEERGSVPRD